MNQTKTDRFVREKEAVILTGLSRTTIWRWERAGKFPLRYNMYGTVAWKLSELIEWMNGFRPIHN